MGGWDTPEGFKPIKFYGVHIYQQFTLQILYYKTSLSQFVGLYWLPWIACVITFILVVIFSCLTLRTRLGRFLMG